MTAASYSKIMVNVPDAVKLSPTSSLPERMTGTAERDGNEAALIKKASFNG